MSGNVEKTYEKSNPQVALRRGSAMSGSCPFDPLIRRRINVLFFQARGDCARSCACKTGHPGKVFASRPAIAITLAMGSVWQACLERHMIKIRKGPYLKGPDPKR